MRGLARSLFRPEFGSGQFEIQPAKRRDHVRIACGQAGAVKTLGLSILVAVGTLLAMVVVALGFFTSGGGLIFPAIVAWGTGSLFAVARRPRYLWLQVAAIGMVVAALINLYGATWHRLFSPPPGYIQGGPNMPPPPDLTPVPPPR
jgi:hypothetical protein